MKTKSIRFCELKKGDIFIPADKEFICFIVVEIKHNLIFYAHIEVPEGKRYFKSEFEKEYVEVFFEEFKPKVNWKNKNNVFH